MALVCFNSFALHPPLPLPLPLLTAPVSRLHLKPFAAAPPKCLNGVPIPRRTAVIAAVAAEDGGASAAEPPPPAAVENLPLESKVKEREEQRARMKLAKKIRLRRSRLVRKRRLRKKGRWPPSKMKKLKNV